VTVSGRAKRRLSALLMAHAADRLRRRHPEWVQAMVSEGSALLSEDERLRWSAGCAFASYRAPGSFEGAMYPAALAGAVMLMTAYQWSADESLRTVAVICLTGLALGVLRPRRYLVSGAAVGLVVAAVNSFETVGGLRPAYETTAHSLQHDARWMVFIAPGLIASAIGGCLGRKLRPATDVTP
jgi:hypothetical protein